VPIQSKPLEKVLVDDGVLTQEQVDAAQHDLVEKGGGLGAAAARLGFCGEDAVPKVIAKLRGTRFIDVNTLKSDVMEQLAKLVPAELANKFQAVPVGKRFEKYTFAVVDPHEPSLIRLSDELFRGKRGEVELWVSGEGMILTTLEKYFPYTKKEVAAAVSEASLGVLGEIKLADGPMAEGMDVGDLEVVDDGPQFDEDSGVDDAPVIKWVNNVIFQAVAENASDIHLDPTEHGFQLRYRIDGTLRDIMQVPGKWRRAIPAVIKVKTKQMKIEEKRVPQDAKIKIRVPGKEKPIDLRVSTLPVQWGEKVVMRILDSSKLFKLTELGFEDDELAKLERAINAPQGMVIVTGPTGCGKTNTLYSALSTLNEREWNIMTVENPIEFVLPGINQVPINAEIGMTFALALKSFLRQDPDIILVGEMRDYEEAEIGITAAMTGHVVLTTLHTNDAPSTLSRLMDMRDPNGASIDPSTLAAALNIIVAQRLMKPICKNCKAETTYPDEFFSKFGLNRADFDGVTLYRGEGCAKCGKSGYKGRIGIFEVMEMTRPLRDMVMARKNANELRDEALKEGMRPLRDSAILKVKKGISTLEETVAATSID